MFYKYPEGLIKVRKRVLKIEKCLQTALGDTKKIFYKAIIKKLPMVHSLFNVDTCKGQDVALISLNCLLGYILASRVDEGHKFTCKCIEF